MQKENSLFEIVSPLARMQSLLRDAPQLMTGDSGFVWVHSDLQLNHPNDAREVLTRAVDDLLSLDLEIGAAWCLGDALIGHDRAALEEVAAINIEQLARLEVPVCFVMGNHEMDIKGEGHAPVFPLYEQAGKLDNWHTMERVDDFFFARDFCGTLVIFMGDHAAEDGRWCTRHGRVDESAEYYPHSPQEYSALRDALREDGRPVATASHYAYPGGQRPSALQGQLLPLPENVRLHLYGHAHIGDLVHNRERPWQRDNPIEGQTLQQFNISALETKRSPGSHSALLELGPHGSVCLHIRCHLSQSWTEHFPLERSEVLV